MITVPEIVEDIIRKSPFLDQSLYLRIINLSALARVIKPEVEKGVMKEVHLGAIIMALNRLSKKTQRKLKSQEEIFSSAPDLMVRSNLFEITLTNSNGNNFTGRSFLDNSQDIWTILLSVFALSSH